jgi:hypothetical protein
MKPASRLILYDMSLRAALLAAKQSLNKEVASGCRPRNDMENYKWTSSQERS